MVFSGQHHQLKTLTFFNQCVDHSERRNGRNIVVNIARHQHELSFQVAGQLHIGGNAPTLAQPMIGFAPPLNILIVIMNARSAECHLLEIGIRKHGCYGHKASTAVSTDANTI